MVVQQLVRSVFEFPGMFVDGAAQGSISALLVLFGAILVGIPVLVFAVLALPWLASVLTPSRTSTLPRAE